MESTGSASLSGPSRTYPDLARIAPSHCEKQGQHGKEGDNASHPHHVHHHRPVFSGSRIVVVAIKEELIHWRTNLILRRLDETETQISRCVLDPIKISREFPFRSSNHYAT